MRNRGVFYVLFVALNMACLTSCIDRDKYAPKPYVRALEIVKISDTEYMHISYLKDSKGGYIPCNGYIYINTGEALIFDTPINDTLTTQLVHYIQDELKATVRGVVVNHSHLDASGGLKVIGEKRIPTYGSLRTAKILAKDSLFITNTFDQKQEINLGETKVYNYFFGEAHTADNIVSYIPENKTLVGGCMIKSQGATKGNIKEANLAEWSETVTKIRDSFPEVMTVIPGHGGIGDKASLNYTISLFSSEETVDEVVTNLE